MSTYSVEVSVFENVLVEANSREEAEEIAVTEIMEGFDVEPNQVDVTVIKEVK